MTYNDILRGFIAGRHGDFLGNQFADAINGEQLDNPIAVDRILTVLAEIWASFPRDPLGAAAWEALVVFDRVETQLVFARNSAKTP